MVSIQELPGWFLKTKAGAEIAAEQQQSKSARRQQLCDQLAALQVEREAKEPQAREQVAAVQAKLAEATAKIELLQDRLRQAMREHSSLTFRYDQQRSQIEAELRATADQAIDSFLAEMRELSDREQQTPIQTEQVSTWDKRHIQQTFKVTASNRGSIVKRGEYVRRAMQQAEQLRVSPACDVSEQLEALRAGIPTVEMEAV